MSRWFFCRRRHDADRWWAFTIVELMIAVSILSIFLFFAYRLFLGGAAPANKGTWINATVGEFRNTTAFLTKEIKVPDSGEIEALHWVSCKPERPPSPGNIPKNGLWPKANPVITRVTVGDIVHTSEAFTFTASANFNPNRNHARSGILAKSPLPNSQKRRTILRDELIHFTVPESFPTSATNFAPMDIRLCMWFPQDARVFKGNSIMVTPNVGISLF